MRRKTIEDCYKLAEIKKGKCLSTEYVDSKTRYRWECKFGHQFSSTYNDIHSGGWCPECNGSKRKTVQDCAGTAGEKGGQFLSTNYENTHLKYKWRCKLGHEFWATYHNVCSNHWCPVCAGIIAHTIDDCRVLAEKNDGIFLSDVYKNAHSKCKWKCKFGHEFTSSYTDVRIGHWCPKCSKNKRLTVQDCCDLAQEMGGQFLSDNYKNAHIKYLWCCSAGHNFPKTCNAVQSGSWCPKCKNSKGQRKIIKILKTVFGPIDILSNYRDFDWLRSKGRSRQEFDIWVPSLKLAIEFDGIQHFIPIGYFGGEDKLKLVQQLDILKNQKIAAHPEDVHYFIRFNYKETITEDYVKNKLLENNVPLPFLS